jgi:hypothetical protein
MEFVCCEDGKYVGTHLAIPMLVYLITNRPYVTFILVTLAEIVEYAILTSAGSFEPFFARDRDFESLSGVLLGDVLVQGGLGLLIGMALRVIFLVPGSFAPVASGSSTGERAWSVASLAVFYAQHLLLAVIPPRGRFRVGNLVVMVLGSAIFFFWYQFGLPAMPGVQDPYVYPYGAPIAKLRKLTFFFTSTCVYILSSALQLYAASDSGGLRFEWYVQWYVMVPVGGVLWVVATVVSVRRRDWGTAVGALAFALWGGAIALLTVNGARNHARSGETRAGPLFWSGMALAVVGLLAVAIALVADFGPTRLFRGAWALEHTRLPVTRRAKKPSPSPRGSAPATDFW